MRYSGDLGKFLLCVYRLLDFHRFLWKCIILIPMVLCLFLFRFSSNHRLQLQSEDASAVFRMGAGSCRFSLYLCCVPELLISDVILYSLRIRRSAGSCVYGRNMLFLPACVHLLSLPEYGIISTGRKVLFWFICFCFERCPLLWGCLSFLFPWVYSRHPAGICSLTMIIAMYILVCVRDRLLKNKSATKRLLIFPDMTMLSEWLVFAFWERFSSWGIPIGVYALHAVSGWFSAVKPLLLLDAAVLSGKCLESLWKHEKLGKVR